MVFTMIRLIPGDVAQLLFQEHGHAADIQAMRVHLGLDRPLALQYLRWLTHVLQGDLGVSLWTKRAVSADLLSRLLLTLELAGMAWLGSMLLAIPMGLLTALRQHSLLDYLGRGLALGGLSIPSFWLGTMAIVVPAYVWGWTPPLHSSPWAVDPWRHVLHMLLPASLLGCAATASLMRLTRALLLDVLRQDDIRTAWAKGGHRRLVVGKHALRQVLVPVLTVGGIQLGHLAGGAVLMESLFGIPGMGSWLLEAIALRDYPVVQGINLVLALLIVVLHLCLDLTYGWLDPRLRVP